MIGVIKQLLPPILVSAIKRLLPVEPQPEPDPIFSTYQDALDFCASDGYSLDGYQTSDLVACVIEKNAVYRDNLRLSQSIGLDSIRPIIGIAASCPEDSLRVLDFGGGGGSHYSVIRAIYGKAKQFQWDVVETEAMARAATAKLAREGLKFFGDIDSAVADLGEVDLVFTSGALQYTPSPLAFLAKLIAVNAKHIFVTRTTLNEDDETIICVQTSMLSANGPGPLPPGFTDHEIRYPLTLVSKREAKRLIVNAYNIRFSIVEDKASYSVNGKPISMFGYFGDLKN